MNSAIIKKKITICYIRAEFGAAVLQSPPPPPPPKKKTKNKNKNQPDGVPSLGRILKVAGNLLRRKLNFKKIKLF